MLLWTIIKVSLHSLTANKLRSFLAMLGIIIGVGAVISMLALGAGAQQMVMHRITAMGTNLFIVRPGFSQRGGVRSGSFQTLKIEDAEAILEVPGVETVAPIVQGRAQVKYYNQNSNTSVTGAASTYFSIRDFEVEKGRSFSPLDEEHATRVAILGSTTATSLFGTLDPLGESVRISNVNFRVIGVLKSKGDQGWFNPDDMVVVPFTTAMRHLLGQIYLSEIDVKAAEGADMTRVGDDITALLHRRHHITGDQEDDFNVRSQAEIIETASSFMRMFTILLGGIASISLLVGGIGIMNIMLVTVTERTHEIGVRKAIGARDRDILRQFLLESILISGLGGVMGVFLGLGITAIVSFSTDFAPIVETQSVVLAISVAASVGIFFGWYPARRAAALDPIVALRSE
ncbi:MAG TPA: ABC transporter permease [Planctomycetota bacterium]|nr:ABC transporter permease [Planctomycetota bacterium]